MYYCLAKSNCTHPFLSGILTPVLANGWHSQGLVDAIRRSMRSTATTHFTLRTLCWKGFQWKDSPPPTPTKIHTILDLAGQLLPMQCSLKYISCEVYGTLSYTEIYVYTDILRYILCAVYARLATCAIDKISQSLHWPIVNYEHLWTLATVNWEHCSNIANHWHLSVTANLLRFRRLLYFLGRIGWVEGRGVPCL